MNINYFTNTTTLNINATNLTDATNLVPTLITNSATVTDGYFGLGIMISMFLVLLFTYFRDDGDTRVDIMRSIMMSSGFVSIIGLIMLISGLIGSFMHVMWFLTIFIISFIITFLNKQKGY